jgi:hypothetical protein
MSAEPPCVRARLEVIPHREEIPRSEGARLDVTPHREESPALKGHGFSHAIKPQNQCGFSRRGMSFSPSMTSPRSVQPCCRGSETRKKRRSPHRRSQLREPPNPSAPRPSSATNSSPISSGVNPSARNIPCRGVPQTRHASSFAVISAPQHPQKAAIASLPVCCWMTPRRPKIRILHQFPNPAQLTPLLVGAQPGNTSPSLILE